MQQLTASPHIRSDRLGPYPHSAYLRRGSHEDETHLRNSLFLAQGWHGHHPSRADCGRCRETPTRWLKRLDLCRLEHRSLGHKAGCEIAPERHDQLARQGHDGDALDALAGIECASPILLGEFAVRLMSQPQPGHLDRGATGAWVARLADPLVAIDPAALPWTGRQPEIARDLAPIAEVFV